ncbi:hypothetical protein PANDA_011551 [Ailuropoda melanoleuca]|uniref:Ig-like domain-containing protein n=1 Tax=Ailuropoda melanoleuca TaxID=9646 RepID=D2HJQ4_AILME|nr:hypothetical protein PANDA_011551 [Ailuropoda melanoleuca]
MGLEVFPLLLEAWGRTAGSELVAVQERLLGLPCQVEVGSPGLLWEPEILSGPQNLMPTVHWMVIALGHPWSLASWSSLALSPGLTPIGGESVQVLGTGHFMIPEVSVQHCVCVCAANRRGSRVQRTAWGVPLVCPVATVLVQVSSSGAMFTCVAQGVPEPRLVWLKNGKVLSPRDNIRLAHDNTCPRHVRPPNPTPYLPLKSPQIPASVPPPELCSTSSTAGGLAGRSPPAAESFPSTRTLVGLSDEIKAIYQRATENRVGSDQASGLLAVTGDPEPPLAPRGLPVMALSTSAIPGSWEPPASNRDITGYVLNLWPMGDRVWALVPLVIVARFCSPFPVFSGPARHQKELRVPSAGVFVLGKRALSRQAALLLRASPELRVSNPEPTAHSLHARARARHPARGPASGIQWLRGQARSSLSPCPHLQTGLQRAPRHCLWLPASNRPPWGPLGTAGARLQGEKTELILQASATFPGQEGAWSVGASAGEPPARAHRSSEGDKNRAHLSCYAVTRRMGKFRTLQLTKALPKLSCSSTRFGRLESKPLSTNDYLESRWYGGRQEEPGGSSF